MLRIWRDWDLDIIFNNIGKLEISSFITYVHTRTHTNLHMGQLIHRQSIHLPSIWQIWESKSGWLSGQSCSLPHHVHLFPALDAHDTRKYRLPAPISVHVTLGYSKEKLISEPYDF